MSKSGKRIAVIDYGYDLSYKGSLEFTLGWRELLEPLGWTMDFFYHEEIFNNLRIGDLTMPFSPQKWVETSQLEGYDFALFGCTGKDTGKSSTVEFVDKVLGLRNPISIFVDHQRHPVRSGFRQFYRKPQYVYAFDYTLTCNSLKMYEKGGVPLERVRPVTLWHTWKMMRNKTVIRSILKRPIILSYVARMTPTKGIHEMYDFVGRVHEADPTTTAVAYGWSGSIGEMKVRKQSANIMNVRRDGLLKPNSPGAFVLFHKANYDQPAIFQVVADSRYSWCALKIRKNSEERWINPAFEGSTLVALRCRTVPIINGLSRKLDVLGIPLEAYGAVLFVDDNDTDRLAEEFLSLDHEAQYRRTEDFASMFFDPDRFEKTIVDTLEEFRAIGHQPRCKVEEVKFTQVDPDRDILGEHQAERREARGG